MYCKYCGKELAEDELCTCSVPAPRVALGESARRVSATVADALKSMAAAFRQLLVNTSDTHIPASAAASFAACGLIAHILAWLCIVTQFLNSLKETAALFGGTAALDYMNNLFKGIYGSAAWGGCVTFFLPLLIGILIPLTARIIRKEAVDILPCFIAGIRTAVLPSAIFLLAGLVILVAPKIGFLLIGIAAMTVLVLFYKQLAAEFNNTDSAAMVLLIALLLSAIAALSAWAIGGVITSYFKGTFAVNLNDTVHFTEILKQLLSLLL